MGEKKVAYWNLRRTKTFFGHFGLLSAVTVYTVVGALIFQHLEQPAQEVKLERLALDYRSNRDLFLAWHACRDEPVQCSLLLDKFSLAIYKACKGGISLLDHEPSSAIIPSKWSFPHSAFFATTVLTTIGYGNVVPETFAGRCFCIIFALIGIPLTLTVIADMGVLVATAVSILHVKSKRYFPIWRVRGLTTSSSAKWLSVIVGLVFLIVYLAVGAALFMFLEDGWGFFEGFYFCFITMTTIGFGDLVPGGTNYMAFCTIYILVGLSLTSTIIELVRRQYAQSWKTIQALSGPIAESLKRLGECGSGIDVSLIHGDLRKLLTMMKDASLRTESNTDWQQAVDNLIKEMKKPEQPPTIQIIIYESSV